MRSLVIIALLSACVSLPDLAPATRGQATRRALVVRITAECGEYSLLPRPGGDEAMPQYDYWQWAPDRAATAVIVDDRHLLTAAHVVACPALPQTEIWLPNKRGWLHPHGEWFHTYVDRDFAMFPRGGEEVDLARVESASDENFDLNAAPVVVGPIPHIGEPVCVDTLSGELCAPWQSGGWLAIKTQIGDSGAPAYDQLGRLVGVVHGTGYATGRTKLEFERLAEILR